MSDQDLAKKMWIFGWKGPSGFSARSTAEEVTQGIDGTGLTAIVTGFLLSVKFIIFLHSFHLAFLFLHFVW